MRWLRRRGSSGGDETMFAVLAEYGIPLEMSAGDPGAALTTGVAKAGIYHAHVAIGEGRPGEAIEHVDAVLDDPALRHPAHGAVAAAAFAVRGRAHEANGHPIPARVAYEQAVALNPSCRPAADALTRLP